MKFNIPELGENIDSGTVVSVHVSKGDEIKKNDTLFELETEKAVLDVPSPVSGKITEVLIHDNQDVKVGQHVLSIEQVVSADLAKNDNPDYVASREEDSFNKSGEKPGLEIREKAETLIQTKSEALPKSREQSRINPDIPPAASPSVRQQARDLNVDLNNVAGSGPGGKILPQDLESFTDKGSHGQMEDSMSRREPMSRLRKTIAKNIEASFFSIPHVTQNDQADITELENFRKKINKKEKLITPAAMIIKVLSRALQVFPVFNSSIDMEKEEVIYKDFINIGVAVDTENGLIVPVIKNVPGKSLFEIAEELSEKSEKARARKLEPDEMSGGTFTFTNLGSIGGSHFTPIIRKPEVAILGTGRSAIQAVYTDNEFKPRLVLPISLSYDHRIIDGAQAARFLRWVAQALESPWYMELSP